MDRTLKKSLAIPKHEPPAEYRAYTEHPEVATLNQIMLHYLDIEEILKLYRQNYEQFETRQALDTLTQRFKLPAAADFKQLLQAYDMQYATVRSYLYNNRIPRKILYQAAVEGNIQAFYNQLKLYPKLRKKTVYTEALGRAAEGGHEVIMELLFDLGAKDKHATILVGAAKGCQLELVLKELDKGVEDLHIQYAVKNAASHRHKDVVATLLDYSTTSQILTQAMIGAGQSGDIAMIDYIISRGGDDYKEMINTAAIYQRLNVIRHYWDKLTKNHRRTNELIAGCATDRANLEMVKFVIEKKLANQEQLSNNLKALKQRRAHLHANKRRLDTRSKLDKHAKLDRLNNFNNELAAVNSVISYLERNGIISEDVESYESSEESSMEM